MARGWRRYAAVLTSSHVWLLAPTWIAINAALGLWASQSLFQLIKERDFRFSDQALMGGFVGAQVALALGVALVIFFAGLAFWGERFRRYRRTTIIFYGIFGGALSVVGAGIVNHAASIAPLALAAAILAGAGLFVLAGATPAALGLLADMSEAYPRIGARSWASTRSFSPSVRSWAASSARRLRSTSASTGS